MESGGFGTYRFDLPLVFVKGQPADYKMMSSVQLRKFTAFAYRRYTKEDLPDGSRYAHAPSWWSSDVVFGNELRVKGSFSSLEYDRLPLMNLLESMYSHFDRMFVLNLCSHLANSDQNGFKLDYGVQRPTTISTIGSFLHVDADTLTYDTDGVIPASLYKTPFLTELLPSENQSTTVASERIVKRRSRRTFACRHCSTVGFGYQCFRDEHEAQTCDKNVAAVATRNSYEYFITALGLIDKSRPPPPPAPSKRMSKKVLNLRKKLLCITKEARVVVKNCKPNTKLARVVNAKSSHLERYLNVAITQPRVPLINCLDIPEFASYFVGKVPLK